jgi:glycopeptide antibiotics resistance protein
VTVKRKRFFRIGVRLFFYLYIIIIFYFVLLSERYGRETGYQTSHVNLVLFKEISRFWEYRNLISAEAFITNLFGNVFAFSPFGLMIPMIIERKKCLFRTAFATFVFSLLIETSQLIMKVGVFDVDDLLLNSIGGIIGYFIYRMAFKLYHMRKRK